MKILVIDSCNFIDFPTGGHLSFVRNMLSVFPEGDLALVGITTDPDFPIGKWTTLEIDGKTYDYFAVKFRIKSDKRPLEPARFTAYRAVVKYIDEILSYSYDRIFFQAAEILLALPKSCLKEACICIPGVENPLHFSRYVWARRLSWLYDVWYYRKLSHVKTILASASDEAIQEFVAIGHNIVPLERIHKFPTRFNLDFYHAMDQAECRSVLNIPQGIPVFVTVGRLAEFKGWRFILEAFSLFLAKNPSARMYFIGDGEDELKLREYITAKGLQDVVFLTGRKAPADIGVYLNAASVFLMGSVFEGWPTTLVEACGCGVPCVVTLFSSAEDMIEDGKNGYVVRERNPESFAGQMQAALELNRSDVIEYDRKYESLAVQNMRTVLLDYIK